MFHYLIFNDLKFQLNFICLGFAPHDITVIKWFWLEVVREKSTHSSGGGQQLNLKDELLLYCSLLKAHFQSPTPPKNYCAVPYPLSLTYYILYRRANRNLIAWLSQLALCLSIPLTNCGNRYLIKAN